MNLTAAGSLQFVMARVGRRLRAAWQADPAAVGVLHELAGTGSMRISALATTLALDISTISRHVSALESDGLVAREADPRDRRATLLTVTPAGREYLDTAIAERAAVLRAATAAWPDDDVVRLHDLLNRLAEDLGNLAHGETNQ